MNVFLEVFDRCDFVLVQVELAQVRITANVFDLFDLVVGEIHPLKSCGGCKVKHARQVIAAGIQFN